MLLHFASCPMRVRVTAVDFVEFPSKFGNLLKQSHSSSENIFKPSECILEMCNLEELASFSKKNFMEGVKIFCPLWFDCIQGASDLAQHAFKECGPEINSLA